MGWTFSPVKEANYAIRLQEDSDSSREHVIEYLRWQRLYFLTGARVEIEDTRLIAANHTGCSGTRERDGESDSPGKLSATGDREDDRQFCGEVESSGRDDQHWSMAALLMPVSRVERHHVDIAAIHSSSLPAAGASIHSLSSDVGGWE
jgi:hypothetical protein